MGPKVVGYAVSMASGGEGGAVPTEPWMVGAYVGNAASTIKTEGWAVVGLVVSGQYVGNAVSNSNAEGRAVVGFSVLRSGAEDGNADGPIVGFDPWDCKLEHKETRWVRRVVLSLSTLTRPSNSKTQEPYLLRPLPCAFAEATTGLSTHRKRRTDQGALVDLLSATGTAEDAIIWRFGERCSHERERHCGKVKF